MKNIFLAATVLLFAAAMEAAGEEEFPGIKALMPAQEFEAAGLRQLSAEQLEALDNWLLRFTAGEAQVLVQSNPEVRQAEREQEILSELKPPFSGWTGNTIFHLQNGQVWRQRRAGRYVYRGADLRVAISRNFLGFHKMTLLNTGKSVQVSRLK